MQLLALIVLVLVAVLGAFCGGMTIWHVYLLGWASLARRYRFRGRIARTADYHYRPGWARACRFSEQFVGPVCRLREGRLVNMRWAGFEASLNAYFPYLPRDVPDAISGSATYELDVGANSTGLYLAVQSGLKIWHPPLFIPWSDIAVSAERIEWANYSNWLLAPDWGYDGRGRGARVSSGWLDCLVFRFRKAPKILLQLREEDAQPIVVAAGSSWPELVQIPNERLAN
jgi:hypothetical protein